MFCLYLTKDSLDRLETAFGIAFDFDTHRAEERWKDEDGALNWPKVSQRLAAEHGKILPQISHVVRSSGGKVLGVLLAINPLPVQDSTIRSLSYWVTPAKPVVISLCL